MAVLWKIYAKIYIFKLDCRSNLIFKLCIKKQEECLKQSKNKKNQQYFSNIKTKNDKH